MSSNDQQKCIEQCILDASRTIGCSDNDTACFCDTALAPEHRDTNGKLWKCAQETCPEGSVQPLRMKLWSTCADHVSSLPFSRPPWLDPSTSTTTSLGSVFTSTISSSITTRVDETSSTSSSDSSSAQNTGRNPTEAANSGGSSSLSPGVAAGIAVGVTLFVVSLAVGGLFFWRRHRKQANTNPELSDTKPDIPLVEAEYQKKQDAHHEPSELWGGDTHEMEGTQRRELEGAHGVSEAGHPQERAELPGS